MRADLMIDSDVMSAQSQKLSTECENLRDLIKEINDSFAALRKEWDSDAGKKFFDKFENDLISNLEKYSTVFEHMSMNLSTAQQKYESVFRAADAVTLLQY